MGRYEFVEDFNFRYYLKYENLFQGYLIEKSIRQEAKHLIDFNLASFLRNKAFEKIYPFYKNTWAGIAIVSSNQKSFIKNTRIKNAKGFYFGENVPSGAILAYQSNIEISNTDLDNIFASSAVRLISSRGKIKNISLHKILGDGIFSSNSSLELKDSNFSYIADDGLFLSKSKFLGEGLEFKLYGDCGVFAIDKTKAKLEKSSLKGGLCGALISKNTSYEEKNIKYQKNRLFDKKLDYEFLSEVDKFTR
jgi:hypothetical protein